MFRPPRFKNNPDLIREAHDLHYKQGHTLRYLMERYGINHKTLTQAFKAHDLPVIKYVRKSDVRFNAIDWTPIADIKPRPGIRGYSTFTMEEAERIRNFLLSDERLCCALVARYLGTHHTTINSIYGRRYKGNRPALPTVEGKAEYQRRKSQRKGGWSPFGVTGGEE